MSAGTTIPAASGHAIRRAWASLPPGGRIGGTLVAFVLLFTLLGPLFWTTDPDHQNLINAFADPSAAYPLGADDQGRDVMARLMAGGRISLLIGASSMLIGLVLGSGIGLLAAQCRGWVEAGVALALIDLEHQRLPFAISGVALLLALPGVVQAVILAAILGRGVFPLIVALGIYSTPIFARVAYSAARQVIAQDYVNAAIVLGANPRRIVLHHVLPNMATPLTSIATLRIGTNILTGAALNFFGLGVQPPGSEWGLMISDGRYFTWEQPLLLLLPGIALFVTGLGFNLLGDGLRDWLDPKSG